MSDALTDNQVREIEQIAELQTRRYFDHYLRDVWPVHQKALREHTHLMIEAHDAADSAHGGVENRMNRFIWMFLGAGTAGGLGGAGALQLLNRLLGG